MKLIFSQFIPEASVGADNTTPPLASHADVLRLELVTSLRTSACEVTTPCECSEKKMTRTLHLESKDLIRNLTSV